MCRTGHFSTPQTNNNSNISLYINNFAINPEHQTKFLGIHFDKYCKWNHHISYVIRKISPYVGIISLVRYFVPLYVSKQIYFSFIHSVISYGIEIWGNAYAVHLNPLKVLQNKAIRYMTFSDHTASADPLYKLLGIQKLDDIYRMKISILAFKLFSSQRIQAEPMTGNRRGNQFKIVKSNNNYGLNYIVNQVIRHYNNIPLSIRQLPYNSKSVRILKRFLHSL